MKRILILSLALIVLLGITGYGTSSFFSDTETSGGNTFTAWVEEVICAKFNVSDKKDGKIYKYDDTGAFVSSFNLSGDNGFPTGVATEGDSVYVIDHAKGQVYQYNCSGTLRDVSKGLLKADGKSSIGNIDGLAIDGDEMWVLSGNDKNIYLYSLSSAFTGSGSLTAIKEIALADANQGALGLAIDSDYLYVVDYATSTPKGTRFYRYLRADGSVTDSKILLEYTSDNKLQSPAGVMFDGTSLWVVDSGKDKVYKYDKDDPFPGSNTTTINALSEFGLHGDNDDASGL